MKEEIVHTEKLLKQEIFQFYFWIKSLLILDAQQRYLCTLGVSQNQGGFVC